MRTIVKILTIFVVICFASLANAQTRSPPKFCDPANLLPGCQPNPSGGNTNGISGDIISKIQSVALADLEAASADAKATGDTVSAPCYDAWIKLITAQQTAQAVGMPDPHLITSFQRTRDLVNALRPGSPMKVACAPLAEELKQDVIALLGKIATGAITAPALLAPLGL